MFKKLDGMLVRKKMITGYLIVIVLMVFSGILAIVGETILLRNLSNYSNKVQRADTAVQMCRLNVNIAARNIREMALNDDKSSYDTYKKNVDDALKNIDQELDAMKKTGVIEDKLYNQYVTQMNEWGTIGMDIIDEIEAGNQKDATENQLVLAEKEEGKTYSTVTLNLPNHVKANKGQSTVVENGSKYEVSFTAEKGYKISSVTVNGEKRNPENGKLTLDSISGNTTITVTEEKKAAPTLTLSSNSGIFRINRGPVTFTYTYNGDGAVTATSSDDSVATAEVKGNTPPAPSPPASPVQAPSPTAS